jgi:hypothetical protein
VCFLILMAFFGTSRRVARRTARRTSRRWGAANAAAQDEPDVQYQAPPPQYQAPPPQPQQAQPQQSEDPVKLLQVRLAKGEITPEQYQASLKILQGG